MRAVEVAPQTGSPSKMRVATAPMNSTKAKNSPDKGSGSGARRDGRACAARATSPFQAPPTYNLCLSEMRTYQENGKMVLVLSQRDGEVEEAEYPIPLEQDCSELLDADDDDVLASYAEAASKLLRRPREPSPKRTEKKNYSSVSPRLYMYDDVSHEEFDDTTYVASSAVDSPRHVQEGVADAPARSGSFSNTEPDPGSASWSPDTPVVDPQPWMNNSLHRQKHVSSWEDKGPGVSRIVHNGAKHPNASNSQTKNFSVLSPPATTHSHPEKSEEYSDPASFIGSGSNDASRPSQTPQAPGRFGDSKPNATDGHSARLQEPADSQKGASPPQASFWESTPTKRSTSTSEQQDVDKSYTPFWESNPGTSEKAQVSEDPPAPEQDPAKKYVSFWESNSSIHADQTAPHNTASGTSFWDSNPSSSSKPLTDTSNGVQLTDQAQTKTFFPSLNASEDTTGTPASRTTPTDSRAAPLVQQLREDVPRAAHPHSPLAAPLEGHTSPNTPTQPPQPAALESSSDEQSGQAQRASRALDAHHNLPVSFARAVSHSSFASALPGHSRTRDASPVRRSSRRDAHMQARIARLDTSNLSTYSVPTLKRLAKDMGLHNVNRLSKSELVVQLVSEIILANMNLGWRVPEVSHGMLSGVLEHEDDGYSSSDDEDSTVYKFGNGARGGVEVEEVVPQDALRRGRHSMQGLAASHGSGLSRDHGAVSRNNGALRSQEVHQVDVDTDFESLSKLGMMDLQQMCEDMGIRGWAKMRKFEIISALLVSAYEIS